MAALCAVTLASSSYAGEVAPAQFDTATENPYRNAWNSVAEKFGQDTAGRHVVALGWRNAETGAVREPTRSEVVDATERLKVALNPPAPEPVAAPETTTAVTPTTAPPVSSGSGCTGMEAESGSAGYSAYNPSSGATGCYQVIPSTAAAFDCDLSTPAGQDACAVAICAGQGPGAWSASGANPC